MYGGEWEAPMTTGGPVVSGIQEYLAKLQSQGLPPTPQNVNRIREATSNGVTLPRPPIPPAEGVTSAAPTSVAQPDPNASNPGAASSGLLESLAPLILGGAPLAAILGRRAMDMRTPAAEAPGASLLRLPAPEVPLQVGGPETPIRLGGPTTPAQVEGARAGTPQLAAPGEAPAIKLPAVPTGNPTIPLPDSGPTPRATPETTPKGPGFDTEYAPSPAKEAIDKAVEEPKTPRAKSRAKTRLRVRIGA
jgi:hypothetical protein